MNVNNRVSRIERTLNRVEIRKLQHENFSGCVGLPHYISTIISIVFSMKGMNENRTPYL